MLQLYHICIIIGTNRIERRCAMNDSWGKLLFTCFFYLFLALIAAALGGIAVNYLLLILFDKNIPFWGDMLIGLFGGGLTIPIAVIIWVLKATKLI